MNIKRAINYIRPGIKYSFVDYPDYAHLLWPEGSSKPTEIEVADADLPASKAERIARAYMEASTRIYTAYPAYAQSNAALGLYDSYDHSDPFYPANMKVGIQAVIDSLHTAITAINALTNSVAVDSFTW